jgi:hypothetical protein
MKSLLGKLGVILIGLLIFVTACQSTRGGDWKFFSSTDLYEGFYYVSKSHLLYKGTVLVSVKLEYTEKGIAEHIKEFGKDYENLSYSLQSWEVDCRAKTERILSINQYSVEGNILNTKPAKSRLSESLGKSLSETVCK